MNLREAAKKALEVIHNQGDVSVDEWIAAEAALRAALAEAEETDLSKCPNCGGPADNGHDRCIPPNPYHCTKCSAEEPVVWQCRTRPTWGNGHGLEEKPWSPWEFCSKEVAEDCWRVPFLNEWAYDARALYTHPPRRGLLAEDEIIDILQRLHERSGGLHNYYLHAIKVIKERAHGIGGDE